MKIIKNIGDYSSKRYKLRRLLFTKTQFEDGFWTNWPLWQMTTLERQSPALSFDRVCERLPQESCFAYYLALPQMTRSFRSLFETIGDLGPMPRSRRLRLNKPKLFLKSEIKFSV